MNMHINAVVFAGLAMSWLATDAAAVTQKMDFNGDGLTDLAIGSPFASVNGKLHAGNVTVLYGSASFFSAPGMPTPPPALSWQKAELWTKDLASVPGEAKAGDEFGAALAAGDFNGDGYSDLAIGVPGGTVGGGNQPGSVIVLYGSSGGLMGFRLCFNPCTIPNPVVLTAPSPHNHDGFGHALAAGRFNTGPHDDLAVGAPHYDLPNAFGAGAVRLFYGQTSGLTPANSFLLSLINLEGSPEHGDQFGRSLAAGNFDGGPADTQDLAIGIPMKGDNGAVSVVYGTMTGLSTVQSASGGGSRLLTQNMTSFPSSGVNDGFGHALAAGNFRNGPADSLAIGIPYREIDGLYSPGAVMVLNGQKTGQYGATFGLMTGGAQLWTLASNGVPGSPSDSDHFGASLAAGDLGYDGAVDLAIGMPMRDTTANNGGAALVLYGLSGSGLTSANSRYLSRGSQAKEYDYFGRLLSIAKFGGDSHADLAVGMPQLTGPGEVWIYYGSNTGVASTANQNWTADSPGVPGEPSYGGKFGWGLSK